jgi:oligosaccharyltransferase complex subunit alpha (ribophorin I)
MDGDPNYPSERSGDLIFYGPFYDIKSYAFSTCRFQYEYKPPILTLTQLARELEVSHWGGNVAVEEHFALKHDGAL